MFVSWSTSTANRGTLFVNVRVSYYTEHFTARLRDLSAFSVGRGQTVDQCWTTWTPVCHCCTVCRWQRKKLSIEYLVLQEDVSCEFETFEDDANAVVDAMDRPPGQSRTGGSSNLLTDAKGLFWLLDEESLISGASEESFIERLNMFYGNPKKDRE